MKKTVDLFFKLLEFLVVACLVAMVIMVFGNVVLRYGFNSGITVSEEMSRYCFIWLTYIGAMIAMREAATWASTRWSSTCRSSARRSACSSARR